MNFLALTNQLRVECGVSGPALTTVQALTSTTENSRLAVWIQTAWNDIQTSKEDWLFLRKTFSFSTVAQQSAYTAAEAGLTDMGNWKLDSFRCSSLGSYTDEQLMNYMDWTTYRNLYLYGSMRTTYTRPVVMTVTPAKDLGFGAIPDQAYTINAEYFTTPVTLSDDTDSPSAPTRFHMIVVYRAMMYYGGYEAAPEVLSRGSEEYQRLYSRLEIDQLPTMVNGPPLA